MEKKKWKKPEHHEITCPDCGDTFWWEKGRRFKPCGNKVPGKLKRKPRLTKQSRLWSGGYGE